MSLISRVPPQINSSGGQGLLLLYWLISVLYHMVNISGENTGEPFKVLITRLQPNVPPPTAHQTAYKYSVEEMRKEEELQLCSGHGPKTSPPTLFLRAQVLFSVTAVLSLTPYVSSRGHVFCPYVWQDVVSSKCQWSFSVSQGCCFRAGREILPTCLGWDFFDMTGVLDTTWGHWR